MIERSLVFFRTLPFSWLVGACLLLALPAFLVHLGMFAFTGDEAIRSLVALEMKLSGNYIATTMHGADYINKPPLFNWFVLLVSDLWGSFGEWPARLTTLIFLGLFGYLHFRVLCRQFDPQKAVLGAFMLVTSGRFLFYDSMLGLIDTAFSATVYALFMSIWFLGDQKRWRTLFVVSYLLMAIGFLLKGFPAIVFQGFSLFAGLLFFRQWKKIFSWEHVVGGLLSLAIIGTYLWVLSWYRPLDVFLENLLHESTKRTVVAYDWGRFWKHLFKFPFDSVYHFLPWSLLIVLGLDRKFWQRLRSNRFAMFNFVLLLVNLPVYWTSVQVNARYLLMFIPLFNTVGLYLWQQHRAENTGQYRLLNALFGAMLVLVALGSLSLPFIPAVNYLPWIGPIALGLFLVLTFLAILYFKAPEKNLWWLIMALLVVRIGFDLVVIPVRTDESIVTRARRDVRALADKYEDRNWYVYGDTAYIREPASFYFTQRLNRIIPRTMDAGQPNAVYIVSPMVTPDFPGKCLDTLQTDYPEIKLLICEGEKQ